LDGWVCDQDVCWTAIVRTFVIIAGLVLILAVWGSALRTVFTPREASSRTALWTVWLVGTGMLAVGRRLPMSVRENFLGFSCPLMLLLECGGWLAANVAGFALLQWGTVASPGTAAAGTLPISWSPAEIPGDLTWLFSVLMLAIVVVHLGRVTSAYSRRERLVCRLSTQATRSLDAESILAEYIRGDGDLKRLGNLFGRWSDWLADVQSTHLAYPALTHYRSSGAICWSEAAQIMLDCAALAEAVVPSLSPPEAVALLAAAEHCFSGIARRTGVYVPPVVASHQGRENCPFGRTYRLIRDAGAPVEKDERYAQLAFQRIRVRYAPYTNAICERLLYKQFDQREFEYGDL
jgi:hypothetical protein